MRVSSAQSPHIGSQGGGTPHVWGFQMPPPLIANFSPLKYRIFRDKFSLFALKITPYFLKMYMCVYVQDKSRWNAIKGPIFHILQIYVNLLCWTEYNWNCWNIGER